MNKQNEGIENPAVKMILYDIGLGCHKELGRERCNHSRGIFGIVYPEYLDIYVLWHKGA